MKKSTIFEMKDYLRRHVAMRENGYLIDQAFKIFADREIESVEDFVDSPYIFTDAILECADSFRTRTFFELMNDVPDAIQRFREELIHVVRSNEVIQNFNGIVTEMMPRGKDTKVLNVASGRIPMGAFELAQSHDHVDAIDKFFVSDPLIKKFNVEPHNQYVDETTDVSGFDMMVAHMPCGATNDIIKLGAKFDKPYLICFCGCGLPHNKVTLKVDPDWQKKLRRIDPRIKFFSVQDNVTGREMRYGYVSELPSEEVEKIIVSARAFGEQKREEAMLEYLVENLFRGLSNLLDEE